MRNSKVISFLKQNLAFVIIVSCIVVLSVVLIAAGVKKAQTVPTGQVPKPDNPSSGGTKKPEEKPTDTSWTLPVSTEKIGMDYSDTEFVWNEVLGEFSIHQAVDFLAEAGCDVYAVMDGTVKSVEKNTLDGTVIVIDHGDGIVATYGSLAEDVSVKAGDKVKKGDCIGKVSDSALCEFHQGHHLHFVVEKNGKRVNPREYLKSLK